MNNQFRPLSAQYEIINGSTGPRKPQRAIARMFRDGCALTSDRRLEIGAQLCVRIVEGGIRFIAPGTVIRYAGQTSRIRFNHLTEDDRDELQLLLAYQKSLKSPGRETFTS